MSVSIGAAIIAKDAAKDLPRALESLEGVCSQIVVADTGSKDETPKIAARRGAELYFFEWRDDFSAARNKALSYMRTEWILSIDADEALDAESLANNAEIFEDPSVGGIYVEIESVLADGSKASTIYPRIFRNSPKIRYEGKIHEQISPSIMALGLEIAPSTIKIYHYGYENLTPEKIDRNKTALERVLKETPYDDFAKYNLAETEFAAKNFERAEKLFLEIADSFVLSSEQKEKSRIRLAQIYLSREEYAKAAELARFSSADAEIEGLRNYVRGVSLLMGGNLEEAERELFSPAAENSSLVAGKALGEAREALIKLRRANGQIG